MQLKTSIDSIHDAEGEELSSFARPHFKLYQLHEHKIMFMALHILLEYSYTPQDHENISNIPLDAGLAKSKSLSVPLP